jgi:hypothetical protein
MWQTPTFLKLIKAGIKNLDSKLFVCLQLKAIQFLHSTMKKGMLCYYLILLRI